MMLPIIYIPVIFVSIGIASDNLMLSAMSGSLATAVRPGKLLLILCMLLSIQMQAFLYGTWLAKLLVDHTNEVQKWIALSVLIATAIRMYQEFKLAERWKGEIPFGFNGFLNIALATSIYVFVLGFAFHALNVCYRFAYLVSISAQAVMLIIGWYAGKQDCAKTLAFIKKASLIMMVIGIMIFFIQ